MTFSHWNDYWIYQLPEWDNYNKEDIENILKKIEAIKIIQYLMAPDKDIWTVRYKNNEFIIVNDLVYGCEVRTANKENLSSMENLIKIFDL